MGAGDPQLPAEQMADHRFGASQRIHARALAVGHQGRTAGILRKAGHHGDGRGPSRLQLPASPQQGVRAAELAPAGATGSLAQGDLKGCIGGDHRANLQSEAGATALGHLQVAPAQLLLDTGIEQQTHPLPAHRLQRQRASGEPIQRRSLHVVDARVAPVERRPVHHVGVGDQAATGGR